MVIIKLASPASTLAADNTATIEESEFKMKSKEIQGFKERYFLGDWIDSTLKDMSKLTLKNPIKIEVKEIPTEEKLVKVNDFEDTIINLVIVGNEKVPF